MPTVRGDYAGTDAPKTCDGMTIDVNDILGMQPDEFDPALHFAAGWTDEAAVCVAHPRVKANVTLQQLKADILRLRGRTGPICTEAFARQHGALLFNRSRPRATNLRQPVPGSSRRVCETARRSSRFLECVPGSGQVMRFELTPFAGLPENGSQDEAPISTAGFWNRAVRSIC